MRFCDFPCFSVARGHTKKHEVRSGGGTYIINCSAVARDKPVIDISKILDGDFRGGDEDVLEVCRRVDAFNSLVNESVCDNSSIEDE